MVFVPGGDFQMGVKRNAFIAACSDVMKAGTFQDCEKDAESIHKETDIFYVHVVQIPSFWIDRYEVTIEQYRKCSDTGGCLTIDLTDLPALADDPRKPQVRVSWYGALMYRNARGARLPTEAEWEYAAKGPNNLLYPWGNTSIPNSLASANSTSAVGRSPENKSWIGAYDMSGNAAEWVENRFLPYQPNLTWISGSGLEVSRVIRGGSWLNGAVQLTTFYRNFGRAGVPREDLGFRCARSTYPTDM
jgi:iron(II)-dependent oxidoreductase